jgi:hypothetical protein
MTTLWDALNAARRDGGAAPLRLDRSLCVVAERAQDEFWRLGRGSEDSVYVELERDLQGFNLSFTRTRAVIRVVKELRDAPQLLSAALDPELKYGGLVVAPAPPPTGPHDGYSVVLALGE